MTHKRLRSLIETTVASIHDAIQFSFGSESNFNEEEEKSRLRVNLAPLTAGVEYSDNNVNNYSKTWNVQMAFYKVDHLGSTDYPEILDETDNLVDRFVNKLNLEESILITGISQESFIQAEAANPYTGHLLSFAVRFNDDFEYCDEC